jgi:hypothetical protein
VELAGLEPATSWVRSGADKASGLSTVEGSPAITGDPGSARTTKVRLCGSSCTRLRPVVVTVRARVALGDDGTRTPVGAAS